MRDSGHIWSAWRSGALVGDYKPCTRVTVEKSFSLRTSGAFNNHADAVVLGQWKKGPARWWQRSDTSPISPGSGDGAQVETELPNVLNVSHTASIESDAGGADIVMLNVIPQGYGEAELVDGQFGDIGGYSFDHGGSQEAKARWGHAANPWFGVLVPNALIRIYQGFGGHDKELADALVDGNLVLNGVYLVDEINISTAGTIHLKCRDMAKLLVDQQIFPPLVPANLYPVKYCRYTYQDFKIPPDPPPAANHQIITETCEYGTCGWPSWNSSTDEYYGEFNTGQTGHPPAECLDWSFNDPPNAGPGQIAHQRTYWLSEPKGAATDTVWIQFCTAGNDVNMVYYHPWAGNYVVMVSIMENGEWVAPEAGGQGGITPQGIPYVSTFTTNWEGGQPPGVDPNSYYLPRDYRANQVRLTMTNLAPAQEGGFRAGARKIIMLYDLTASQYPALSFACCSLPYNTSNRTGYWQVRSNGRLFAFGDARVQPVTSPQQKHDYPVIGMTAHPDGAGYWTIDYAGRVVSHGSGSHWGDAEIQGKLDIVDIAPTPSGSGYWILHKDGQVDTFGDASYFGNATVSGLMPSGAPIIARSIESHPSTQGYWVLLSDGTVQEFNLTNYGSANRIGFHTTEYVASIRRTHDGGGYWIPSGRGEVQAFGNAPNLGNAVEYPPENWVNGLCWDMLPYSESDNGYAVQYADGNLYVLGDFEYFGSIGAGQGQLRLDGNYKDYADIIRDLALWSGFYLRKSPQPGNEMPAVYGNIESTGIFAKECLPQDIFDKKPVMEAMKTIRDIVGYIVYVDQEGGFRFESPNWWQMGNFKMDGTPFDFMPEIDEQVNLFDYSMSFGDTDARSEIIISSIDFSTADGTKPPAGTPVTRIIPPSAPDLKGLIKPAMWTNGVFTDPKEQKIMGDLIAMHMWFARRKSNITCTANPLIGINDQVRVYERQSGEVYVHYVRGTQFNHDLVTGDFTMTLTTHWMGSGAYGQTPLFFACAGHPDGTGYWQVDSNAQIYAFGAAELFAKNTADSHTEWVIGMRPTPTGEGYWTLDASGKILAYGDAVHHGDLVRPKLDVKDFCITPDGLGYWVVTDDGAVHAFGSATNLGDSSHSGILPSGDRVIAHAIESHPSTDGYWVLWTDGFVDAIGLPDYGSANRDGFRPTEYVGTLRRTDTGDGYWIPSGSGIMQAFGDAVNEGNATYVYPNDKWAFGLIWDMIPHGTTGYGLQHADGSIDAIGSQANYGSVGVHGGASRRPAARWPVVSSPELKLGKIQPGTAVGIDDHLAQFLAKTGSPSANNAVAGAFGAPQDPTTKVAT